MSDVNIFFFLMAMIVEVLLIGRDCQNVSFSVQNGMIKVNSIAKKKGKKKQKGYAELINLTLSSIFISLNIKMDKASQLKGIQVSINTP